ncbi:hypothetical protein JXA32_05495 [Candidatus Sumerlaeota bacterium]|nr:hypothetical protein [Candidatus Sumerlaeota bacterium]
MAESSSDPRLRWHRDAPAPHHASGAHIAALPKTIFDALGAVVDFFVTCVAILLAPCIGACALFGWNSLFNIPAAARLIELTHFYELFPFLFVVTAFGLLRVCVIYSRSGHMHVYYPSVAIVAGIIFILGAHRALCVFGPEFSNWAIALFIMAALCGGLISAVALYGICEQWRKNGGDLCKLIRKNDDDHLFVPRRFFRALREALQMWRSDPRQCVHSIWATLKKYTPALSGFALTRCSPARLSMLWGEYLCQAREIRDLLQNSPNGIDGGKLEECVSNYLSVASQVAGYALRGGWSELVAPRKARRRVLMGLLTEGLVVNQWQEALTGNSPAGFGAQFKRLLDWALEDKRKDLLQEFDVQLLRGWIEFLSAIGQCRKTGGARTSIGHVTALAESLHQYANDDGDLKNKEENRAVADIVLHEAPCAWLLLTREIRAPLRLEVLRNIQRLVFGRPPTHASLFEKTWTPLVMLFARAELAAAYHQLKQENVDGERSNHQNMINYINKLKDEDAPWNDLWTNGPLI